MRTYVLDARTATPHFPGIGRYVASLARALVPLLDAQERLVVLSDRRHPPALPEAGAAELLPTAVWPFSLRQQWQIPALLRRVGADLYHSAYYLMPYRPGVPTVLTVYDLIPILFPQYSTRRARLLFRWMMAMALRAADRSIAISQATLEDVRAHFSVAEEAISVVPLAADPAFAPQDAAACDRIRELYAIPKRYVLYVGSNKPHKNLGALIGAWHQIRPDFPDHALVIAGAWIPDYPGPRERAAALGLGPEAVRWLGPIPEADLPALYAAATLFVFPSLYEGFGLPVIEAMACGTPVVCANRSSLPEVAGDAATLFDPGLPESLTIAMRSVLSDPAELARMAARGLAQAATFSWERTAQATLDLYRRICAA